MSALKNPKHEAFALAVAEGATGCSAYRDHVSDECSAKSAFESASRLMASVKIASRVSELRSSFGKVLAERLGVRQETIARYLVANMETPIGEVDAKSSLCQEHKVTQGDGWTSTSIKMPGELDAVDKLMTLCGWKKGTAAETKEVDALTELIDRIRMKRPDDAA